MREIHCLIREVKMGRRGVLPLLSASAACVTLAQGLQLCRQSCASAARLLICLLAVAALWTGRSWFLTLLCLQHGSERSNGQSQFILTYARVMESQNAPSWKGLINITESNS